MSSSATENLLRYRTVAKVTHATWLQFALILVAMRYLRQEAPDWGCSAGVDDLQQSILSLDNQCLAERTRSNSSPNMGPR